MWLYTQESEEGGLWVLALVGFSPYKHQKYLLSLDYLIFNAFLLNILIHL